MDCAYSIDGYKSKSADHPAKTLYTAITAHFHADTAVIACRPCPSTGQGGDLARTCIVFPLLSIYRPQEFYTIEDKAIVTCIADEDVVLEYRRSVSQRRQSLTRATQTPRHTHPAILPSPLLHDQAGPSKITGRSDTSTRRPLIKSMASSSHKRLLS